MKVDIKRVNSVTMVFFIGVKIWNTIYKDKDYSRIVLNLPDFFVIMENERNVDKLSGYIIKLALFAIVVALCWYFKNVLIYIAAAFVVSLVGQPIMKVLRKITIKKKPAPDWLLAIVTLLLIFAFLILVITQIIPLVSSIIRDASALNVQSYFA